jgi:hypothetical protein
VRVAVQEPEPAQPEPVGQALARVGQDRERAPVQARVVQVELEQDPPEPAERAPELEHDLEVGPAQVPEPEHLPPAVSLKVPTSHRQFERTPASNSAQTGGGSI